MTHASETGARKRQWPIVVGTIIVIAAISLSAASLFVYSGAFDVAADTPHSQPVYWLMQKVRQNSVNARAADVVVPNDLGDAKRINSGAAQYAEMCSSCHLAPGMERTEISRGLYPRAPELRRGSALTPSEEFWVVKHGIKMTAMPAWGVTHNDEILWDVVAFLRKLPELSAEEYQALVKNAPKSHEDMMKQMNMDGNGDDKTNHELHQ